MADFSAADVKALRHDFDAHDVKSARIYATALGAICALVGRDDFVIMDKLVHACIVDAAKLSGAKIRIFDHNDLNDLEDKLKWATENSRHSPLATRHTLIVTESIFSMDGDATPLRKIVRRSKRLLRVLKGFGCHDTLRLRALAFFDEFHQPELLSAGPFRTDMEPVN